MTGKIPEIKFSYKNPVALKKRVQLNTPLKMVKYFRSSWNENTIDVIEEVKVLLLNQSLHVLGMMVVSRGGGCAATVDLRLILTAALKYNGASLAICHNHPSGSTKPSLADEQVTYQLAKACEIIGIRFLEHIVITRNHHSFVLPKKFKNQVTMSGKIKPKVGDTVTFTSGDGSEKQGRIIEALPDNKFRIKTVNKTIWRVEPDKILSID